MSSKKDQSFLLSRRNFITRAGVLLGGGIAAYSAGFESTPAQTLTEPPPLPWKWVTLDPLEGGRRAYRSYHEKKG